MLVAAAPPAVPARAGRTTGPWHASDPESVLDALSTSRDGLSGDQAEARRRQYGANRIPAPPGTSIATILGNQLRSVVVWLLAAATILSIAIGDRLEAAAIAAVLAINSLIGFVTEWRARRAMEALLRLEASRALVRRDGQMQAIAAELLVPGDIVVLEAGNKVPADVRLLETSEFGTDEAALTGESLPVEKTTEALAPETVLADRGNMAYLGTTATSGSALGAVVAIAGATELGRIGTLVGHVEQEPTTLEKRLDALGRRLVWATLGAAGVIAAIGMFNGIAAGLVLQTAIALAVAAMPEALPAVATIALAVGMRRMARRHALVRRLPAVESLGSATMVCTDKTRTLTTGEMTVTRVWAGFEEFAAAGDTLNGHWAPAAAAVLAIAARASRPYSGGSESRPSAAANPVDAAVLATQPRFAAGPPQPRAVAVLPFSSRRKLMAVFEETDAGHHAAVKGALVGVLPLCSWIRVDGARRPLTAGTRLVVHEIEDKLARGGLRLLAVASGRVSGTSAAALDGLTFEGLIGIADPVAPGVPTTVTLLRNAGLRTVMITGDQRSTAEAIGRAAGLFDGAATIVEGRELAVMTDEQLAARVDAVEVFSRVAPEDKLRIVEALQQRGEIVAMLGDGVNDAAALKRADVGVAMGGRGTDVARQAAAIVLQDDRFETIAAAVEEGRVIFDNIRKFVFYLFSCNVAEILVLLAAGVAGMPLPLLPLQLLWLNMVTDTFPALALAMEPGDDAVMRRPPRDPREAILSGRFVASVLIHGAAITIATLAAFVWALRTAPDSASTIAFMTLAFTQILHLGNARSDRDVLAPRRATANRFALFAVVLAAGLQLATAAAPLAATLGVTPLSARQWMVIAGCSVVPALAGQLARYRGS